MATKSIIALKAIAISGSSTCYGQWILGTDTYQADALYRAAVGPGVTQTSIALTGPTKQRIFYAEIDLTNPYIMVKTPKGQNRLGGEHDPVRLCRDSHQRPSALHHRVERRLRCVDSGKAYKFVK